MCILDSVKSIFAPSAAADPNALWLYVRCSRCGTPLAVRVDTRNELSADYERDGYVLHKEMTDNKCFTLMHAELHFDQRRNVTERKVDKGEFITRQEYEASSKSQNAKSQSERPA